MTTAICLKAIGNVSEFKIDLNSLSAKTKLNIKHIPTNMRRTIGFGNLEKQHDFIRDDVTISFYAWVDGEPGDENKHDLPPPMDNYLYFGNSYLIATKNKKIVPFDKTDYYTFTHSEFYGFDELGSEDSWSEEESVSDSDSIHQFIVEDTIS
tara:strand:- start:583 stop:1038 length:456 start_codon:yes stop_codon:yes gene_type:complete